MPTAGQHPSTATVLGVLLLLIVMAFQNDPTTDIDDKAFLLEARSNAVYKPAGLLVSLLIGFTMTFSRYDKMRDAGHAVIMLTTGGLLTLLQSKTERGAAYSPAPTTISLTPDPPRLPQGPRYSWQKDGLYGSGNEFSTDLAPTSPEHDLDSIGVQVPDQEI